MDSDIPFAILITACCIFALILAFSLGMLKATDTAWHSFCDVETQELIWSPTGMHCVDE